MKKPLTIIITVSVFILVLCGIIITLILTLIPASKPIEGETKFIAHRGLSSIYFENSNKAFVEAGKSRFFYGIETDIWRTLDGKYICAHNNNPFKDTDIFISKYTYKTLANLPLKTQNSTAKELDKNEKITVTTFEEYLSICKYYGKVPIIEVKAALENSYIIEIIDIIEQYFDIKDVYIISFIKDNLDGFYAIKNDLPMMFLTDNSSGKKIILLESYDFAPYMKLMNKFSVSKLHKEGKKINIWTINNSKTVSQFKNMGVDFITTDYDFS